jgi:hypothetical protein
MDELHEDEVRRGSIGAHFECLTERSSPRSQRARCRPGSGRHVGRA